MKFSSISRNEWLAVGFILLAISAIVLLPPNHRETRSESCHLCGNRRIIVRDYRWWQLASEQTESVVSFPIADGHEHNWWQYGSSYVSFQEKSASSNWARYRDGRTTWTP